MELYSEASSLMDTLDWEAKARVTATRVKGRARKLAFTAVAALSFASIQNSRVRRVLFGQGMTHHFDRKMPLPLSEQPFKVYACGRTRWTP